MEKWGMGIAMVKAGTVGSRFLMRHGFFMLCLGMILCSVGSWMTNPQNVASGYMLAVVVTSVGLLVPGILICMRRGCDGARHSASRIYFMAGIVLLACWLFLWMYQSAPTHLRLLVLLAGAQGVFWGLWYLRLAFRFRGDTRKASGLCILAGVTSVLGMILATQSHLSAISAVTAVACYSLWIGVKMLATTPYLYRSWANAPITTLRAGTCAQ